jgi:siroheme synthase (precorrin-2 oxidase/ferrochelatase)
MRFLPVFVDVTAESVALFGAGSAALNKLHLLQSAGAKVRWFTGDAGVPEKVLLAIGELGNLKIEKGEMLAADLTHFGLVLNKVEPACLGSLGA